MPLTQHEALRLIVKETARLTRVAEAAAIALRNAVELAGNERMSYQTVPSEIAGVAMREAAKIEADAYWDACQAHEAVETAHAARTLLVTAIREEEREKRSTG